jgi:dihydrodipicolinate synthase/N-acetylneuraminate lyase
MITNTLTSEQLSLSVLAVPPLARHADLSLNLEENRKLIHFLESGGIRSLLYGGNANLYNISTYEYEQLLEFLQEAAGSGTLVIPSVGPAFGTMMMQARILKSTDYPTAMVLPPTFATMPEGLCTGIRCFVEASGKQALLYIKREGMMTVEQIAELVDEGLVSGIKYAIVRTDAADDPYLEYLVSKVDPRIIVSGIGEQPAIIHMKQFGLQGFTSGCVCVQPKLAMKLLHSVQKSYFEEAEPIRLLFKPLEDLRNDISPIRVLHEAVRLADVADTGPMLPHLTNLDPQYHQAVQEAALELKALTFNTVIG